MNLILIVEIIHSISINWCMSQPLCLLPIRCFFCNNKNIESNLTYRAKWKTDDAGYAIMCKIDTKKQL